MQARKKPYTIRKLWKEVKKTYHDFIHNNKIEPSSEEDKEAYELASNTVSHMIKLGDEVERISFWTHAYEKASKGYELSNLFEKNFGPTKLPPIRGKKSLAFAKEVVIPLEDKSGDIEHEWWMEFLCGLVFISLKEKTQLAKQMAEELQRIVNEKENEFNNGTSQASSLTKLSVLAAPANKPSKKEIIEDAKEKSDLRIS